MTEKVRKKWLLVWYLDVNGLPDVQEYLSNVKNSVGDDKVKEFFEDEIMAFYVPIRNGNTRLELHEIILDKVGYDKYETIINNKNLNVQDVLDRIKELLDVEN